MITLLLGLIKFIFIFIGIVVLYTLFRVVFLVKKGSSAQKKGNMFNRKGSKNKNDTTNQVIELNDDQYKVE